MTEPEANKSELDSVSKRLKYAIAQSGVKQSHIAKKLGVTRGAIHYILNNEAKNPRSAKKIVELLGVDPEWVYTGTPKKFKQKYKNEQKFGLNNEVPLYYLDQILIQYLNPDANPTPIGKVLAQRSYDNRVFAVLLSITPPLQKFETGDVVIFAEKKNAKIGDWILAFSAQEERIVFGMVISTDEKQTLIIHHKIDNPLLLRPGVDDIIGIFVESIKYAKT